VSTGESITVSETNVITDQSVSQERTITWEETNTPSTDANVEEEKKAE
jgi:hypothetical protein